MIDEIRRLRIILLNKSKKKPTPTKNTPRYDKSKMDRINQLDIDVFDTLKTFAFQFSPYIRLQSNGFRNLIQFNFPNDQCFWNRCYLAVQSYLPHSVQTDWRVLINHEREKGTKQSCIGADSGKIFFFVLFHFSTQLIIHDKLLLRCDKTNNRRNSIQIQVSSSNWNHIGFAFAFELVILQKKESNKKQ